MLRCILFLFFFNAFVFSHVAVGQDDMDAEDDVVEITFEQKLLGLYKILDEKNREKKSLKLRLKLEKDTLSQDQIKQELEAVDDIVIGVRGEIVDLSTSGVALFTDPPKHKKDFDWRKDLELIFEPLLEQLREISEHPRLIEKLEADIAYWRDREKELNNAVDNLTTNLEQVSKVSLKKELTELLTSAASRRNTAQQKLSLLNKRLAGLNESKNPIWTTLGDIFTGVVVGILLHFIVAIAVAFFVYQCVRLLSLIPIRLLRKQNPDKTVFIERAIVIGRVVLGVILMVLTYFVALYTFGEWLLLVISLLVIAGVILALKDTVPEYIVEIKALLNMGSIRQGERIIFRGLPWRITRLNVHTRLSNPLLGSSLRVPLTEIVNLSSRASHVGESWFPTSIGNIVLLEDGVFGEVVRQTVDVVEIDFGRSIFTYQTLEFLARRPQNLSKGGFSIYEVFGLDYQHQHIITDEILKTYKEDLAMIMRASNYNEFNTFLTVEFSFAAASSLDFRIIASFKSDVAADYYRLKRFIQKSSVEIANKHGWIIPFQQVTVHHLPEQKSIS